METDLVEGWQISGIESFRTGVPISVGIGYDRALLSNNFASVRPDVIAGCDVTANQSAAALVQQVLLHASCAGTVGNLGKNTVTAPGYEAVDFSLSKDTRIFERLNVQFRAEIFNILNHTNFGIRYLGLNLNAFTAVGGLAGSPAGITGNAANAGPFTSIVGTSRQIQFGVKFVF